MSLNTLENLELLQEAVAAKIAYWDAERALEVAITGNEDDELDDLDEEISALAACCSSVTAITASELQYLLKELGK